MNQNIMKLASLAMKRPSSQTIQLFRILTGLLVFVVIYLFADNHMVDMFGWNPDAQTEKYIEYGLLVFALLPFLHGLTRKCFLKHTVLKKMQLLLALALILIGGPLLDPDTRPIDLTQESSVENTLSGEASIEELGSVSSEPETPHNPSWILVLLALVPLFFGITGKGTYTHCLKYKEAIKKIRV